MKIVNYSFKRTFHTFASKIVRGEKIQIKIVNVNLPATLKINNSFKLVKSYYATFLDLVNTIDTIYSRY